MNMIYRLIALIIIAPCYPRAQDYDRYFTAKSLRMDFVLSGNSRTQSAALSQLREEPVWGGPRNNLIDPFEYGGYFVKAFDKHDGALIFSRGFNTLFEEWRATEQAFHETQAWTNSIVMPFPQDTVVVSLFARNKKTNLMDTLMTVEIAPSSMFIDRGKLSDNKILCLQSKGNSAEKVDLVFVAEGYTADGQDKFESDARRFMDSLFAVPPFDSCRDDFNVWAVCVNSDEPGTDFSGRGIYRNTALNAGFYTFGTDRYLTTQDMKSVRDAVWNVPCDALFILVNSDVYGGGGIYNFYGIGTADNAQTIQVFVHEFGHSFAGLADEYYYNDYAEDFYDVGIEPWEPNITTLVDFGKKWKDMLSPDTPIPTPVDQGECDDVIGVFEGAGYQTKGVYRPFNHCMMRDLQPFCPVCSRAIVRMVDFLTDKPLSR